MNPRASTTNELHEAAADKLSFNKVKSYLEKNPNSINDLHTKHGTAAIDFAAQHGSLQTVDYLIKNGAVIDVGEEAQNLLYWVVWNTPDVIDYITNPNHHIIEKFNDGTTYFHAAIVAGRYDEVMECLQKDPQLLYIKNQKSQSPLFWAMHAKRDAIANSLLQIAGFEILSNSDKAENCIRMIYKCALQLSFRTLTKNNKIELLMALINYCEQAPSPLTEYYLIDVYCTLACTYLAREDQANAEKYHELAISLSNNLTFIPNNDEQSKISSLLNKINNVFNLYHATNARGLKCRAAIDANDSFYEAMIDQLDLLNNPAFYDIDAEEIRRRAMRHIIKNLALYEHFITDDINIYLDNLMKSNNWPDDIAITALSREFNMTFVIIKDDHAKPEIIKPYRPMATLKFGYQTDYCYFSLHDELMHKATISLQKEIDMADVDHFNGVIVEPINNSTISSSQFSLMHSFSTNKKRSYSSSEEESHEMDMGQKRQKR